MKRSFRAAVEASEILRPHLNAGLQALLSVDSDRIRAKHTRRITGSVNLDTALAASLPNSPRWDYGVGYRLKNSTSDIVHWIEVHPATDREAGIVVKKLAWLKQWIAADAQKLSCLDPRYIWISSGSTRLTPTAPALRQLAQLGCKNVGNTYSLD